MKRVVSILILLFVLTGTAGIQFIFSSLEYSIKKDIKHRIKNGVPENDLHVFSFNDHEEPVWVKPGKEFRINGAMFDVVRQEKNEEGVTYYCISDIQETMLFATLGQFTRENLTDEDSPTGSSLRMAFKQYVCEDLRPVVVSMLSETSIQQSFYYFMAVKSSDPDAECPPPDFHFTT